MRAASDPSTQLKDAIAATTRALARKPKLRISFDTILGESDIKLPALPEFPPDGLLAVIRGMADQAALHIRYHDPILHQELKPKIPGAGRLFDILESVRIETLGSQNMQGIHYNLSKRFEDEYAKRHIDNQSNTLLETMEMLARKHIQHMPLSAQFGDERVAMLMGSLREHIENQHAYAQYALELIDTLSKINLSLDKDNQTDSLSTDKHSRPLPEQSKIASQKTGGTSGQPIQQPLTSLAAMSQLLGQVTQNEQQDETNAIAHPFDYRHNKDSSFPYRVYIKQYDEIIVASALAKPEELEYLRRQLDDKLAQFHTLISRLANKLQRLLLAKQARKWVYDQDDGIIDNRKLAQLVIQPNYEYYFKQEQETDFRDTVVTLLIDNSGSMRGRPITMAALCADIISRTLERCGVKVEVLGFTTKEWKGGESYKQWVKNGRPPLPGRLNDLRHIIYKPADTTWRKSRKNLGLMLKDGILKENIDGEAILWACERLMLRPEQRRILMVISDGAPVDDSTLSANSGSYLDKHLREVIAHVENNLPVELLAIGIGHDVTRYYKHAARIADIDQLAETMTGELFGLFAGSKGAKKH